MGSTISLSEAVSNSGEDGSASQMPMKEMRDGRRSGNSSPLSSSGASNGRPVGAAPSGGESHGDSHEVGTNLNLLSFSLFLYMRAMARHVSTQRLRDAI